MTIFFLMIVFVATATAGGTESFTNQPTPQHPARPGANISTTTPTITATRIKSLSPVQVHAPNDIQGQTQVDGNTIALYHFDAPTGSNAIDATNRYTGTLYGNAIITPTGLYGGVLTLDGINSYVRLGNLHNNNNPSDLSQGTIEAFVDFQAACAQSWNYTIISAGGEMGSNQIGLSLHVQNGLMFTIWDTQGISHTVDSGINACRYLEDGHTSNPQPWQYFPVLWPYENWRFHHVAATWGPRGMEIWVDGVLHGIGNNDPNAYYHPYPYMCNPQSQEGIEGSYDGTNYAWIPNPAYPKCQVPVMANQMSNYPPGDYTGGLPPYTTMMIGCDSSGSCFKGRIDELRISNVQRTFDAAVVPTVTPTPTQTPDKIAGEYNVDQYTQALYHLNSVIGYGNVYNEVNQKWDGGLRGNAVITQTGHYNGAVYLPNALSYIIGPAYGAQQGSIEAWVYLNDNSTPLTFISAGAAPYGSSGWETMFFGRFDSNSPNLQFDFVTQNNGWMVTDSGVPINSLLKCWHHVAGTWGPRGVEIWVDGILRNTNAFTGSPYVTQNDQNLYGCDTPLKCMTGKMDEIRISSIQRSFSPPLYHPRSGEQPPNTGFLLYLPLLMNNYYSCQYP